MPVAFANFRLAITVIIFLGLTFVGVLPHARQPLPEIPAFISIYQAMLFMGNLLTAVILFIQFNILRTRAFLALAAGYLFTALVVILQALAFPGLFTQDGLIGAGWSSVAWLSIIQHGGLPMAVAAYVLLKDREESRRWQDFQWPIALTIALVITALSLATIVGMFLEDIGRDSNGVFVVTAASAAVWGLVLAALSALWLRRPYTLLDLWLMVVVCVWLLDLGLGNALDAGHFDLGFYVGRGFAVIASTLVLVVLLFESRTLYAQLAGLIMVEFEERRREAEERRRIFETALDLILVVGEHGDVLRVSPSSAAVLGYEPAEMLGRAVTDFVHPEDANIIGEEMLEARGGHLIRNVATRGFRKNARQVTLAWTGVWSEPEHRYFLIGRDITEQKRVERMKDEFIATVSHELRTPITAIAAPLGLLASGAAGELGGGAKRLVAIAHVNVKRLAGLVNDILDIESIESGTMVIHRQRLALRPLVEQAIALNRVLAQECSVLVRLDCAGVDAEVNSDRDRLMRVLTSLLSNAVKFSQRNTETVVSIEVLGEQVRVAVRDHGPGIPKDLDAFVFEKFAQVDATDIRQKGGMGLGLSIVKQTMLRLGGSVSYEPAPSGGSIFSITVPRWIAASEVEPKEVARAASA
jgi:PAS domain S-box-containing protein